MGHVQGGAAAAGAVPGVLGRSDDETAGSRRPDVEVQPLALGAHRHPGAVHVSVRACVVM